jgi:hypothetical protein
LFFFFLEKNALSFFFLFLVVTFFFLSFFLSLSAFFPFSFMRTALVGVAALALCASAASAASATGDPPALSAAAGTAAHVESATRDRRTAAWRALSSTEKAKLLAEAQAHEAKARALIRQADKDKVRWAGGWLFWFWIVGLFLLL